MEKGSFLPIPEEDYFRRVNILRQGDISKTSRPWFNWLSKYNKEVTKKYSEI